MAEISAIASDERITLYWEKTAEFAADSEYEIICNEEVKGCTGRTHFTLTDLRPDTDYRISVQMWEKGNSGKAHLLGKCTVRTLQQKKRIDVTEEPYAAVPDGMTMNTKKLQMAIDHCREDECLYFPAGVYLSGALVLHSNMSIYLEEGAVLQGTSDPEDYLPKTWSRFEGTEMFCYRPLISIGVLDHSAGYTVQNIVLEGRGTIAGGGQKLGLSIIDRETEELRDDLEALGDRIREYENEHTIPGRARSRLIQICNAQNVEISGLTLKEGACWTVHMIYSDHIVTHDCRFETKGVWNGDGWDPDSSTDCTLFGSVFHTEDDAVAIKSGKNPEGNEIGKPCSHIRIFDCKAEICHGIAIGSEISGGVSDIRIWDCDLTGSQYGIEIKGTRKRGAYVRGVEALDCILPRVLIHSVTYNDDGVPGPDIPYFEKCRFDRLVLTGRCSDEKGGWYNSDAIDLCGFDESGHEVKDISFHQIRIACGKQENGIRLQNCRNIVLDGVDVSQ
ncbi:MAG: glycosyl hydrolase family 28 protein [Butyrivibrio sp.]|nr:glycosyl hydrolase family 28 protein [Butyrivibrio sp.]